MKLIFRIIIILSFSINSLAEVVCISSGKDHAELKEKLPQLFQELPVKLGGESKGRFLLSTYEVFAVINIYIKSDVIVLGTDSWQGPLGQYKDKVEVKKVCFNSANDEIVISFTNNAKDFKGKYADNTVTLPDILLKKISNSQEKDLISKINKKVGITPAGKTPAERGVE